MGSMLLEVMHLVVFDAQNTEKSFQDFWCTENLQGKFSSVPIIDGLFLSTQNSMQGNCYG